MATSTRTGDVCMHEPVQMRQLLDTEKVMFATDGAALVEGLVPAQPVPSACAEGGQQPAQLKYEVEVTAEHAARVPPSMRAGHSQESIKYNIVLETLVLGAPREAIKLGTLLAIAVLLTLTVRARQPGQPPSSSSVNACVAYAGPT